MEHELGIDTEVIGKAEARRVFLPIVSELLAQSNEHAVKPSEDVRRVVDLGLEDRNPCHQDSSGFLVKGGRDTGRSSFGEVASDGGHPQSHLARGVLIVSHELNETPGALLQRLARGGNDLKVHSSSGPRADSVDLPCRGLTNTDFGLADTWRFLASRNAMANHTRYLQLFGGLQGRH